VYRACAGSAADIYDAAGCVWKMSGYGLEEADEEVRVGAAEDGIGRRWEGRMDVVQRGYIRIATREAGKVQVGYADRGAVAFVVIVCDHAGFVEAFEYVVGYYRSECFSVRLLVLKDIYNLFSRRQTVKCVTYLVHDKFQPKKSYAFWASSVATFERLFSTTLPCVSGDGHTKTYFCLARCLVRAW